VLEAARLRQRTTFDLEMMREVGFCSGIENYSRHLSRREPGSRPWTLLDYFPADWLLVVDESHMSIPQVVGMYKNDRSRKEILVDFGFRLPSALDNRPLTFEEFEASVRQAIYVSATPGSYERERADKVVQQLIRPTGVVDPHITVLPTKGQIDDLLERIQGRVKKKERVIVTTLTKRMAEELSSYLEEAGIRVRYLHSEIDTLERIEILRDLRLGVFDVIVGINLLREGIDLRAARNTGGEVVFYADKMTDSMKVAISETDRRRAIQEQWNIDHGITATTISKPIRDLNDRLKSVAEKADTYAGGKRGGALSEVGRTEIEKLVKQLEAQMKIASKALEFERAAAIRDEIRMLRTAVLEEDAATAIERAAERAAREAQGGSRRGAPAKTAPQGIGAAAHTLVAPALDTAADWLPGLRDEHEEETATIPDAGTPLATEAPVRRRTWDPSVTPNVIKRRGERPKRRG
jgi:excinuclease ABC subunit B